MIKVTPYKSYTTSTAEDELNYFSRGFVNATVEPDPSTILPEGSYRVIEGELYRVVPGLPPILPDNLFGAD